MAETQAPRLLAMLPMMIGTASAFAPGLNWHQMLHRDGVPQSRDNIVWKIKKTPASAISAVRTALSAAQSRVAVASSL